MDAATYPFPLAAHSSHHSRYHRFLLGADPAILAPFPKPYCLGALADPAPAPGPNADPAGLAQAVPWRDTLGRGIRARAL